MTLDCVLLPKPLKMLRCRAAMTLLAESACGRVLLHRGATTVLLRGPVFNCASHRVIPTAIVQATNTNFIGQQMRGYCDKTSGGDRNHLEVTLDQFLDSLDKKAHIVDVREPNEIVDTGMIPRAINIPCKLLITTSLLTVSDDLFQRIVYFVVNQVSEALQLSPSDFRRRFLVEKPRKKDVVIFNCRSGKRSLDATNQAHKLGYSK